LRKRVSNPSQNANAKHLPIWKNLGTRAVSAVIFALLCLLPLYMGGVYWAVFAALIGARLMWEWIGMTDPKANLLAYIIGIFGLVLAVYCVYVAEYAYLLPIMSVTAICAVIHRLRRGGISWTVLGVIYIFVPTLMLVWLRGGVPGFTSQGLQNVTFIILVVIAADTAAYFGGSFFKGPKIAAKLSPNKTWSGFFSGFLFALIIGCAFAKIIGWPIAESLIWSAVIMVLSVIGDFFESAIKRRLDVKDAGSLLPGHGGLLDRLDALMMASSVVGLILIYYPHMWVGG